MVTRAKSIDASRQSRSPPMRKCNKHAMPTNYVNPQNRPKPKSNAQQHKSKVINPLPIAERINQNIKELNKHLTATLESYSMEANSMIKAFSV